MKKISLIGCGRWGTFLGWYAGNYCGFDQVDMYDIPTSPNFIELRDTRKNPYLSLSDNMILHDKIEDVLKNDIIIVSIGCQHFRSLCRQLNGFDVRGRTFLLAMKGLETPSAAIMHDIMKEEIQQNIHIAVLAGPGHVQDYMKKVPSCAVIDSYEEETKDMLIKNLQSELIRFYYGLSPISAAIRIRPMVWRIWAIMRRHFFPSTAITVRSVRALPAAKTSASLPKACRRWKPLN